MEMIIQCKQVGGSREVVRRDALHVQTDTRKVSGELKLGSCAKGYQNQMDAEKNNIA